jgi:hypothetical protein
MSLIISPDIEKSTTPATAAVVSTLISTVPPTPGVGMLDTVASKGIPSPKTPMPTLIPAVSLTTSFLCAAAPDAVTVSAIPVPQVMLVGAPNVIAPETFAVLAGERLIVVPATPVTVAPVATPIPSTVMPVEIPVLLATVMAVPPVLPVPVLDTDDAAERKAIVNPGKLSPALLMAAKST